MSKDQRQPIKPVDWVEFRRGKLDPSCSDRTSYHCFSTSTRYRANLSWAADCPSCRRPAHCD